MVQSYIDFNNGNDGDTGQNPTPGGGLGPWATVEQYVNNVRNPGDIATVRRGMTQTSTAWLQFVSDGTIDNPIKLEADYDDVWSDFVTAAETATLAFGSKAVTFAGVGHGVVVGDVIYETTEDNRLFAYEVAGVAGAVVTLHLPYKGNRAGAGRTIEIMPFPPQWNDAAAADIVYNSAMYYIELQGINFHGRSGAWPQFRHNSPGPWVVRDCIIVSEFTTAAVIGHDQNAFNSLFHKLRAESGRFGFVDGFSLGGASRHALLQDCLFHQDAVNGTMGFEAGEYTRIRIHDCEFEHHSTADLLPNDALTSIAGCDIIGRNLSLLSGTPLRKNHSEQLLVWRFLDWQSSPGDTRYFNSLTDTEGTPNYQSDVATVRATGSNVSIEVTPSTDLGTAWEYSWLRLFEEEMYLDNTEHTLTIYVKTNDSGEWTANPLATELWIEIEYLAHATNAHRLTLKSTETVNFTGSTAWQALTVTFTPTQSGVAFLRMWYAKTKEVAKTNVLFVDSIPVES